jgi:hypothetical protein
MKRTAQVITYLFHPLIMPTLGLFLLLNSGTYISLLDPSAKRAILFVMALGTLFFPVIMIPVLYYRNLISNMQNTPKEERIIPQLIILILYMITFVYFMRLPLNRIIHACVLSAPIILFLILLIGIRFRLCTHMAGLGGITGLIIALIIRFESPMLWILVLTLMAAGLTGTARLTLGIQRPAEVYTGYLLGFGVTLTTMLVY